MLFLLPHDDNYYSLFAGIGPDNCFHFELAIAAKVEGDTFIFYDEEKKLQIDYFLQTNTKGFYTAKWKGYFKYKEMAEGECWGMYNPL